MLYLQMKALSNKENAYLVKQQFPSHWVGSLQIVTGQSNVSFTLVKQDGEIIYLLVIHFLLIVTVMHETSAQNWCTGKTQGERVEWEVGGGIGMGNTCKPMAVSFQCMTKFTTNKKKKGKSKKKNHKISSEEKPRCQKWDGYKTFPSMICFTISC